jgi:hypothetical protein
MNNIPREENPMELNIPCPACGAQLNLSTDADQATCPYCGNHFSVDQTKVTPGLKIAPREEMIPEPLPVQSAETESVLPTPEPVPSPLPVYQPPEPPGYSSMPPAAPRRSNTPIIIGLVVVLLLCALCACLVSAGLITNWMNVSGQ